ncbi:MAG: hypothetical protein ACRD6X_19390 [Pyrinomonadaceae bacterium]
MNRIAGIFLVLIFALNCSYRGHPDEAELRRTFDEHKPDFYMLARMLDEDAEVVRISNENVFYGGTDERELSEDRIAKYRQTLAELGIENGIHRDNPTSVRFIASSKGLLYPTSEKSYLYTMEQPKPVVESLDALVSSQKQSPVYSKIEDNWYLVYESW